MQRREKILLIGVVAMVALWWGVPLVEQVLFGPLEEREGILQTLGAKVERKEEEQLGIMRATTKMRDWKAVSLPPDALDAQRLYQEWLTNLAQLVGMEELKLTPGRRQVQGTTYAAVQVSLEGRATLDQVTAFLYHFHRAGLLHRVVQLSTESESSQGSPKLKVSLVAEGMCLRDVPPREQLFPETELAAELSRDGTQLTVKDGKPFPAKPGFRVRIGREYATVTQMDGPRWTIARGVESTKAASHKTGETVELAPLHPDQTKRTMDEFRTLLANNPFAKPAPSHGETLDLIANQTIVRGRSWKLTAKLNNWNAANGTPVFELGKETPEGLRIDAKTGEMTWSPSEEFPAGDYTVTVSVRAPSATEPAVSRTFRATLQEDTAAFTYLVASVAQDDRPEAWLYDRLNNRRMIVTDGTKFQVADIAGQVKEVGREHLLFESDGKTWRLDLGENLRAMQPVETPATVPAETEPTIPVSAPLPPPTTSGPAE